jgi:hypothetical protein
MADTNRSNNGRYIPWPGPQGWGMAAFISILTIALYVTAYQIHKATYRDPRLPSTIPSDVVGSRDDAKN